MRSGAAAGHAGLLHEAGLYGSDEEFLAVVLPFLREGVAAGEPTVSLFAPHNQALVRDALGSGSGVTFVDGGRHYLRPAVAIRRHREMLTEYVAGGAAQIRIAGDVPHPGVGVPWEWWARYEAAANEVYDAFPMYGLCPYDTRTTPPEVLEDVLRTHTHVVTADGQRVSSPGYRAPRDFLAGSVPQWTDPLEALPAALERSGPSLSEARDVVDALQPVAGLDTEELQGMLLSVTEAVGNAMRHGRAPVLVRAWAAPGRMVVTVRDGGPGPADPVAGLMPAAEPGGLGLWLMHQLCAYVSLRPGPDGFTIRLVAENPSH